MLRPNQAFKRTVSDVCPAAHAGTATLTRSVR